MFINFWLSWCHYHWCLWIVNDKWYFVVLSYEINWWLILTKLLKFTFQLVFIWIELNIFVSLKMVFFFNVLHRGLRLNVELFACQWQAWQSQSRHPGHCDTVSLPSMITMSSIVSHRLSFVWFKCSFVQTSLKRFTITILFLYLISQLHSNHFSSQTIFDQFKPNRMSIEFHFLFWKNFQFFPPFLIHKILAHSFVLCIPVSPQNVHVYVMHCIVIITFSIWFGHRHLVHCAYVLCSCHAKVVPSSQNDDWLQMQMQMMI